MQVVRTTSAPKAPCLRDFAELVRKLEPVAEVLKAVPMKHVKRRLNEIVAHEPRFAEEAPLVLQGEKARRAQYTTSPLSIAR